MMLQFILKEVSDDFLSFRAGAGCSDSFAAWLRSNQVQFTLPVYARV